MQTTHGDACDECGTVLFQAGDRVPVGTYLRVDDGSFLRVSLAAPGPLPASFDGHIARYSAAAAPCACTYHAGATDDEAFLVSPRRRVDRSSDGAARGPNLVPSALLEPKASVRPARTDGRR